MDVKKTIKKDGLIKKFCMYGFFKNLKFFEPFLVIYLLSMDLSLFYIGILYSVREITKYIFEIPSGVFADHYGKKTELALCFLLYIVSFVLFFIGEKFYMLCLAMMFFGLGEAFRSGTHKAIILSYLDEKGWFSYKSFVYGTTRSYALIGSSISSFVSVVFLLSVGSLRFLFLLCIVPYVIAFVLILSYPKRFNEHQESVFRVKGFFAAVIFQLKSFSRQKAVIRTVLSSSIFDAIVKSVKDYIQPILQAIVLASSITIIKNLSGDDILSIYLAAIYGVVFLLSAVASRNVYRLGKFGTSPRLMHLFMDILAIAFLLLSLFIKINAIYVIILLYFIVYIIRDARRPLYVDAISDIMGKSHRVTTLSIESQFRALFMAIFAPLFGFIADTFSISTLFLVVGVFCLVLNNFLKPGYQKKAAD